MTLWNTYVFEKGKTALIPQADWDWLNAYADSQHRFDFVKEPAVAEEVPAVVISEKDLAKVAPLAVLTSPEQHKE